VPGEMAKGKLNKMLINYSNDDTIAFKAILLKRGNGNMQQKYSSSKRSQDIKWLITINTMKATINKCLNVV
jgi:hypothetical protein